MDVLKPCLLIPSSLLFLWLFLLTGFYPGFGSLFPAVLCTYIYLDARHCECYMANGFCCHPLK